MYCSEINDFFLVKRYWWVEHFKEYLNLKNNIIVKKKRSTIEDEKICNFLSTLFGNKDLISQESPILADFKNIILKFKIIIYLKEFTLLSTSLEKNPYFNFSDETGASLKIVWQVFNDPFYITHYFTFGRSSRFLLSSFLPVKKMRYIMIKSHFFCLSVNY